MHILIIEDEELASNRLEKLVKLQMPNVQVLAVLDSVVEATRWLRLPTVLPDLIFLDIHLADGNSFDIFKQIEVKTPIIFTTAYDQYAIKAFEVNSIDYLLKPVTEQALERSLKKFHEQQNNIYHGVDYEQLANVLLNPIKPRYQSRFMVKTGAKIRVIKVEQVAYFYSRDSLSFIRTKDGFDFVTEQTLTELQEVLDTSLFYRVHRKVLVHIEAIAQIYPYFKGRVKLQLSPAFDEEIVVSSERTPGFKAWLSW